MDHGPIPGSVLDRDTSELEAIAVLDDRQRNNLPTGRVRVTAPAGATDAELAAAAGYGSSHFGRHVTRYDDGTATVALWND